MRDPSGMIAMALTIDDVKNGMTSRFSYLMYSTMLINVFWVIYFLVRNWFGVAEPHHHSGKWKTWLQKWIEPVQSPVRTKLIEICLIHSKGETIRKRLKPFHWYARYANPLFSLFYVCWCEWDLWELNSQSESFKHVRQWSSIVAVAVVIIEAALRNCVLSLAEQPDPLIEESKDQLPRIQPQRRSTT